MKTSKTLIILSTLIVLLAMIQPEVGLFWQDEGSPFPFTTLHGQTVQMYGKGIYRDNPYFNAPILRGTDAITLFVAIPLLIFAAIQHSRGSLRGGILLTGVLSYFVYVGASLTFGAAYNNLFLLYIVFFSASFFAFALTFRSIDLQFLRSRISPSLPHRGIAVLLFLAGGAVLLAWLSEIISALIEGRFPAIASYTTEVTYGIDLGIIVPAIFLSGILLLRRNPTGYLLCSIFLILLALIGLMVASQTVAQTLAGITLGVGEFIGKAGTFMLLALFAIWLVIRVFRSIAEPAAEKP